MYNILVCDDEKDIVSALEIYLTADGYQVFTAYNGRQAVDILNKEEIHLVLMDIMMPEMNGIEFLSQAKTSCPDTSMILLTGYADKENAIKAINEVGIYKYIEKQ